MSMVRLYDDITVTATRGYNYLTQAQLGYKKVTKGAIFMISNMYATGVVALDMLNTNAYPDMQLNETEFIPINSTTNWRLAIRAIVSPMNKSIVISHNYTSLGTKTVTAKMSDHFGNAFIKEANLQIQQGISNLSVLINNRVDGECQIYEPCPLEVLLNNDPGYGPVTYYWIIEDSSVQTVQNIIQHTFKSLGVFMLNLTVKDSISRKQLLVNITIQSNITGLHFFAGNASESASILGRSAEFLFYVSTGGGYICIVDFGDNTMIKIEDKWPELKPNNTLISKDYDSASEQDYVVSINCANHLSRSSLLFTHHVQKEITGLRLSRRGVPLNTAFTIEFVIDTGTNAMAEMQVDGIKDSSLVFSNMIGRGSPYPPQSSFKTLSITIKVSNLVSEVTLIDTFEVSWPIEEPSFEIEPKLPIYVFPGPILFLIGMSAGYNVRVEIYTGDELDKSKPNVLIRNSGLWTALVQYEYKYTYPGDHIITCVLWNALTNFTFKKQITMLSNVSRLQVSLAADPVVLMSNGIGLAEFVFNYLLDTMDGSHANVSIWPDHVTAPNLMLGPFPLGMDFLFNTNRVPLKYAYELAGVFTAKFTVTNLLSTADYFLSVNVQESIYGFYIEVNPPQVKPGGSVTINAYMMQGTGVRYSLHVDGQLVQSFNRLCK
jgi:hypothetical protein